MTKFRSFPKAPILALFMLSAVSIALATDVDKSTEYPVPAGAYAEITVSGFLRTGVQTDDAPLVNAPTVSPGTPNPADASQSAMTINGNLYLQPLDQSFGDATGAEHPSTTVLRDIVIDENLQIDGDTFKIRSLSWNGENHWVLINTPGYPSLYQRSSEMHVNGDIYAYRFRASEQRTEQDNDQLLFFGPSNDGDAADGDWVEMRARSGSTSPPKPSNDYGWEDSKSILRVKGSPYIILNGYSEANVGVGTENPTYLLQIGDPGVGLEAIGHSWQVFSSRSFKTDITPLMRSDYARIVELTGKIDLVRYRYKEDRSQDKKMLGIIAEEAPKELLTKDGRAMSLSDTAAFLFAAIRGLKEENESLRAEILRLESQVANPAGRKRANQ